MQPTCARSIVAAITSTVFTASFIVSIFAQTNTDRRWDASSPLRPSSDRTSLAVVRVYSANAVDPEIVSIPENMNVSDLYRPVVERMLRLSPTFRRQCLRLGQAAGLTVKVQRAQSRLSEQMGAQTQFRRFDSGRLFATIEVRALGDDVQLIAHEVEHVLEQLDGVDLRARASIPNSGVHECEGGGFETVRALRAGLEVAAEVQRGW